MAVFFNKDKSELIVSCMCGCDESMHIKVNTEYDSFAYMSYLNGNFYSEQNKSIFGVIKEKAKKIWAIIRNKDFYYSDIIMSKEDWKEFKEFVNSYD